MSSPADDYLAQLTPDAFVIYPSRAKLLFFALVGGAFFAGCFGLWNDGRIKYQIVAVLGWVMCGLVVWFCIKRLVKPAPALILNQSGIFDNSSGVSGYFLHWEEIDSIFISSIRRQRFLAIRLKAPELFLSRQSAMKAAAMRMNIKLVGAPVNISANTLPLKLEELMAVIQQKAPAVRVS